MNRLERELAFAWSYVPAIYKRVFTLVEQSGPISHDDLCASYHGHHRQVEKALSILHKAKLIRIVEWKRDPQVAQRQISFWDLGSGKHAPRLRKMTSAEKAQRWRKKKQLLQTAPSLVSLLKG